MDFENTKKAWTLYIKNSNEIPETIKGVRQEIVDSWKRSKAALTLNKANPSRLTEKQLKKIINENSLLIHIAYPYLLDFYSYFKGLNYQILLADKNGYLIKSISDNKNLNELSHETHITEGSLLNEEISGTCGVAITLATQKPMQVLGPEHFNSQYHIFACVGAPIFDPSHHLIGCISIMGTLEDYNPCMMAMLSAAINGIENELKLTQMNNMLITTLNSFNSGIILLDNEKRILHYNNLAHAILHLEGNNIGKSIYSCIEKESIPYFIRDLDKDNSIVECTVFNYNADPIDVSISIRISKQENLGLDTTLLIIDRQNDIHRLTNKVAGFYANYTFDSIFSTSKSLSTVKSLGLFAAKSTNPVLIFGDEGTGKELIAQAIHNESPRSQESFIVLNGDIALKEQLQGELLGYEAGSEIRSVVLGMPGKCELADGGTLFINEIASLSLDVQKKLLNIVQTNKVTRIGGKISKEINIRLIASTSINILNAVQEGNFLPELYYALNIISITIPPLKQIQGDIIPLVETLIKKYNQILNKNVQNIDSECIEILLSYNWPKNLKELENVVEKSVYSSKGSTLKAENLPDYISNYYFSKNIKTSFEKDKDIIRTSEALNDSPLSQSQEYTLIVETLKKEYGNVKSVAKALNIPLSTLYRKLKKYSLNVKDYQSWK